MKKKKNFRTTYFGGYGESSSYNDSLENILFIWIPLIFFFFLSVTSHYKLNFFFISLLIYILSNNLHKNTSAFISVYMKFFFSKNQNAIINLYIKTLTCKVCVYAHLFEYLFVDHRFILPKFFLFIIHMNWNPIAKTIKLFNYHLPFEALRNLLPFWSIRCT